MATPLSEAIQPQAVYNYLIILYFVVFLIDENKKLKTKEYIQTNNGMFSKYLRSQVRRIFISYWFFSNYYQNYQIGLQIYVAFWQYIKYIKTLVLLGFYDYF